MGSSEPVDHVLRPSLPWREKPVSECGIEHPEHCITRGGLAQRVKQQGQKRSALTTCMTCFDTAQRWPTFEQDPIGRMSREFQGNQTRGRDKQRESLLHAELRALATLVEAHREEFDGLVAGIQGTTSLDEHRRNRGTVDQ